MTFVLFGLLSSGRFLPRKDLTKNVNIDTGHAVTALDVSGRGLLTAPASP